MAAHPRRRPDERQSRGRGHIRVHGSAARSSLWLVRGAELQQLIRSREPKVAGHDYRAAVSNSDALKAYRRLPIVGSSIGAPMLLDRLDRFKRRIGVTEDGPGTGWEITPAPATAAGAAPAAARTHSQPDAARCALTLTLAFVVDGVERRQGDVGDFLLAEYE